MTIDLSKLNYVFTKKPLVVGGRAMEYYSLRKSGEDIDLIVPAEDIANLVKLYPSRVKDLWGDLGVCPYEFEIWKTICLLDYDILSQGAIDLGNVLVISLEKLLLMKALAMDNEKYFKDTKLIVKRMRDEQYRAYDDVKIENAKLLSAVSSITYIEKRGPNE